MKATKEPRWVMPFLRALARTGEVRRASEDAGIDHSTAYARRRGHAAFAAAWDAALTANAKQAPAGEEREMAAMESGSLHIPPSTNCAGPPPRSGEDVVAGSQVKRVGPGRWSAAKEAAFFEELAATANVKRAAAAAGVSPNAVYARRVKHAVFRAKWDAVRETARASIDMHLIEEAKKSFDPEALDLGGVEPRVSVAEAIRIVQLHGSRKQQEELPDPFVEEAAAMDENGIKAIRKQLVAKLRRMRDRDMPEKIAAGWSFDADYEQMIPPGWVRAAS